MSDISDAELDELIPPKRRRRARKEIAPVEEPQSLREMLAAVMEESATLENVRTLVTQTMDESHRPTVHCPECGNEFRPPQPDLKKRLDSVIALLEQVEGKAGAMPPADTLITILRPPLAGA
jgi:hypothetical protein